MRPTPLGAVLGGLGWTGFALAFWLGTLAPALVGLLLLAWCEGSRLYLQSMPVAVERIIPERADLGVPFHATTTATVQTDTPLRIEDPAPEGVETLRTSAATGRGRARQESMLRPGSVGTHRWGQVHVHVEDPWALHAVRRTVRLVSVLHVRPESAWSDAGRRAGARHGVQALVPRRHAHEPEPGVEGIRAHQPGDRLRDIDWSHSTKLGTLHTRERARAAPRPYLVVLDVGTTMRTKRCEAKADTAARLARGLLAAASAAGVHATVVALHEDRAEVLPGARTSLEATLRRLETLPAAVPVGRLPMPRGGPSGTAREGALRDLLHVALDPSFVVLVLDAELHPETAVVATRRLVQRGHKVVLVAPATGAHHLARRDVRPADLGRLLDWRRAREDVRRRVAPLGVPLFSLRPDHIESMLQEVAACAR